jgi:hypothetical protein
MRRAFLVFLQVALILSVGWAVEASGALEGLSGTTTIASGASAAYAYVPFDAGIIKDIVVDWPLVDAGDTSSLTVRCIPFSNAATTTASQMVTPPGWSDYSVSAVGDGATLSANPSAASIPVSGRLQLGFHTSTAQEAPRVFRWTIVRKY